MRILELFQSYNPASSKILKPYIIAEAGVNHEGSMDCAKRLIGEAAEGGANAVKFQTYKAETIAIKDSPAYWDTTKDINITCSDCNATFDKEHPEVEDVEVSTEGDD